jgi:hypothetical protein
MTAKKARVKKLTASYAKRRKPNAVLHVIKPDGTVMSAVWEGKLQYGTPPFAKMYPLIGCDQIEHVSVLFQGRRMHMFVDENGWISHPQKRFNWKASAIYANWRFYNEGFTHFVYSDFSAEPLACEDCYVRNQLCIAGTALLWEGDMK